MLLAAGADINQTTGYGWSPLLVATQNRYYKLGAYLLEHGADPNLANKGGWAPLYLATDNRNIENGDYPVRKGDMDHLEFIKLLLDKGADVNARVKDSTETRTVFTNQWLDENGATAFLRASQSGDVELMKLLLAQRRRSEDRDDARRDARCTSRPASAGSRASPTSGRRRPTLEAVKMLLDLGLDPNVAGRHRPHGAARRRAQGPRPTSCRCSSTTAPSSMSATTATPTTAAASWPCTPGRPVDYADGLVRVGVQSAIRASGGRAAPAQADGGAGPAGAADGPHARVDLHHRGVRYRAVTTLDLPIFDR